ncbi:MAG TPA: hypothetical protein DCZ05_00420 [Deltaproteobacteria bacterium]|nr:MAG: hypothetical protein A2X89_08710 [Deltaproteobacteria bacterium GWD2_55_8]HBA38243.1 hypothetical protein [Deltaproteobacteria bacterium]
MYREVEKTIRAWEKQYPDTWILLEVTQEDNGEPVRGKLIATAQDPENFQEIWKSHRDKGILTMLTFGPSMEPRPAVVVSAA